MSIDIQSLTAARLKLRQLKEEIERGAPKPDLLHTLSKLGLFVEDAVGDVAWSAAGRSLQ